MGCIGEKVWSGAIETARGQVKKEYAAPGTLDAYYSKMWKPSRQLLAGARALARLALLPCIPIATSPCAILWIYININVYYCESGGDLHAGYASGQRELKSSQMWDITPLWDKHSDTGNIGARFPRFQPEAPITWSTRLRRPKPGELPVLLILPVTSGSAEADPPPWTLRRRSARVDTPAAWASSQRSTQARTRSRRLESRAQRKPRTP